MVTQNQYSVLRQPVRKELVKISLLNEEDVIVDSFEGIAVDGSVSLSGESTYRRSGSITMIFDKKYNIIPSPSSKIWFNKRIKLEKGIESYSGEIVWFDLGRFAIQNISLNLDKAEKTLSCTLLDYMAFLDGTLGGTLTHKTVIPLGTPINEAIKGVAAGFGKVSIEKMEINSSPLVTPYTIEKEAGAFAYDLIKELIDLYMGYDLYYDDNGYLIVERIRDTRNDPIVEHFTGDDKDLTLNENPSYDFSHVKNVIQVWGKQLDNGEQIKYKYANRYSRQDYSELSTIVGMEYGDICYVETEQKSYVWEDDWVPLEFNVVPIFNAELIGEKPTIISDDNIFTFLQAKLRCEYELTKQSNMAEGINFSVVPLYYLDINDKIKLTIPDVLDGDYIINNLSIGFNIDTPMSINASKLYY